MSPLHEPGRSRRVACLLVPDLPLRAELRASPDLSGQPFLVATGPDARAEVIAVSSEAYRAGIRAGGSVTHARAACSEVRVRVASPALERAARQTLLDLALSFSPRAATTERSAGAFSSEGAVFLDASGISRSFGSERRLASAIGARAEALGLPGSVTVASSRSVARIVARELASRADSQTDREGSVTCVVPIGQEAAVLGPLSIDLLDPDDRVGQQLTRFGVHTVRDLLRLPRRALAQRLGPEIGRLADRAQGVEIDPPLPHPVDARIEEAIDLEVAVDRLEPFLFVLRGMISRLLERLALRHLSCGPLDLHLDLEGGGRDVRRVGVAAPTRDPRVLLRLLALSLETHSPEAAIEVASLATIGQPARLDQLDLFRPRGPDPNDLDRTLSELEALCGPGRVGAPEVPDDHRPDAFGLRPFELDTSRREDAVSAPASEAGGRLVVRALRPPVAAEVRVLRGVPASIRSAVANGHVNHAAGPWRTTGHWWSENDRYAVDHFDVQVSDGTVLRLCFDWITRAWRIDGIYD